MVYRNHLANNDIRNVKDEFTASFVAIASRMFAMSDESASSSLADRDRLASSVMEVECM